MNLNYQELLPQNFDESSRVWIYQSSRIFGLGEALDIEERLEKFITNWQAHGAPVKGYANLFFGQFIVLVADETATGVSGCSTDSSVRIIKQIETDFKVSMFDRQNLAFLVKDKVQLLPLAQIAYALENNLIDPDTIYFNNLVSNFKELKEKWLCPIKNSWLSTRLKLELK